MPNSQNLSVQHLVDELVRTLKSGGHQYLTEAEIVKIERKLQISVSILRGTRNSLQKIHQLPREILTMILLNVREKYLASYLREKRTPFSIPNGCPCSTYVAIGEESLLLVRCSGQELIVVSCQANSCNAPSLPT
ncbi:hypothetical protein K435DRAFT_210905 [Dendrothele bispora CBS 962.96]|uniref:Uncharacterized protein n=1 Tax=Dendrothele bispora (strain CBS 962.96) TaxID=1314807 RepID=A0A4S8LSV0_DENBC|nr:hypothetical protein K435DRAFT_210905 [Dendrothele bispora CBS 962.96]